MVAQTDAHILSIWPEVRDILNQTTDTTQLADLSCPRNRELRPVLICGICERFVQTVQLRPLFYRWSMPMMQGIIQSLVAKMQSAHPD